MWPEFNVPPDVNVVLNLPVRHKREAFQQTQLLEDRIRGSVCLAHFPVCKRNKTGNVRIT